MALSQNESFCWLSRSSLPLVFGLLVVAAGFQKKSQLSAAVLTNTAPTDFFTAHPVSRIQIELSQEALAALRKDGRQYVRATIRGEGEIFRDAGIHLKGTGGFRDLDDKPSLTLDFQRFARKRRSHGLQ